jgi:hypothetical protein
VKRFLLSTLVALGLLASSASAQWSVSVNHRDSITASDTLTIRRDTVYTPVFEIPQLWKYLVFTTGIQTTATDSNFLGDSLFVELQTSNDNSTWTTYTARVDSIFFNSADRDTVKNSTLVHNRTSNFIGYYGRVRFIYWDSLGPSEGAGLVDNVYPRSYTAWYTGY